VKNEIILKKFLIIVSFNKIVLLISDKVRTLEEQFGFEKYFHEICNLKYRQAGCNERKTEFPRIDYQLNLAAIYKT